MGARGGAEERAGPSSLPPRVGLAPGLPCSCPNPWPSAVSPGALTSFPPGHPRCPDPFPQLADPGRWPVTQAPRGTLGGSGSCSGPGPPFPSPCSSSLRFCLLICVWRSNLCRPLFLWGRGQPPGCGGPCGVGGRRGAQKPEVLEARPPTRAAAGLFLASACLPWVSRSAAGKKGI